MQDSKKMIQTNELVQQSINNKLVHLNPSIHYVFKGMVFRVEIINKTRYKGTLVRVYPVGVLNELPKIDGFVRHGDKYAPYYTKRTTNIDTAMYKFLLEMNAKTTNGLPLYASEVF